MDFHPFQTTIASISHETADAITVFFADTEGRIVYKPGQFITIEVEVDGKKERRSYSMCTTHGIDQHPGVCIKRVPGGVVSGFVLANWVVGSQVTLLPPIGNFTFVPDSAKRRHISLVGAGSGITPLMSIAQAILASEPQSHVSLIYGNRSEASIIFKDKIANMAIVHAKRFRFVHVLSQPSANWQGLRGRIDGEVVEDMLTQLSPLETIDQTEFYLCGPQAMMESVQAKLIELGHKKGLIHRESFFSTAADTYEASHADDATFDGPASVKIILDGKEYEITVAEGTTILQAALDKDVDMPYSCQSGLCTACRGKCLEGKVELAEKEGLSDSELEEGYILTCVGHPKSARVVIEIG